jgi:serine/threonine protein kinase
MTTLFDILCPGCFKDKGQESRCPGCGYDESAWRSPLVLPHRTILQNQYLIGRVLGKPGGFGITYLTWDTRLQELLAIKEYLPRDLVARNIGQLSVSAHSKEEGELFRCGLREFLGEARIMAKFNNDHLVDVRSFFEANGTAYLVMDYYEGQTLAEYLDQHGGKVSEETALDIIIPLMNGLDEVHKLGFIHRDIKPQNIYITKQGRAILLDFGAARLAIAERSKSLSVILTPGYAPFEQYLSQRLQGPRTDIYACAAVLYQMVTGTVPPAAVERVKEDLLVFPQSLEPKVSLSFSKAVMKGLELDLDNRPESINLFQKMLLETDNPNVSPPDEPRLSGDDNPISKISWKSLLPSSRNAALLGIAILAALLIGIVAWGIDHYWPSPADEQAGTAAKKTGLPPDRPAEPKLDSAKQIKPTQPDGTQNAAPDTSKQQAIEKLIAAAAEDIKNNRLNSPKGNNALEKYKEIHKLDPGNKAATQGFENIGKIFINLAQDQINAGDTKKADQYLWYAQIYIPWDTPGQEALHAEIEAKRKELGRAASNNTSGQPSSR